MDEVFPVLAGVIVGLVVPTAMSPSRLRWLVMGVLSVVLGAVATWISGELTISAVYLLIDIAQVLGAAVATTVLVGVWRGRRSALRSDAPGATGHCSTAAAWSAASRHTTSFEGQHQAIR